MKKAISYYTLFTVIILFLLAALGYSIFLYTKLSSEKTTTDLALKKSNDDLVKLLQEKKNLADTLQQAANKNQAFAEQLTQVTQTVDNLQWLNMLDPQLLQKYSKVYFLNENYVPRELSAIDTKYLFYPDKPLQLHDRVLPFLNNMLVAASADNVIIKVDSAYRSFATQATLKSSYKVTYGYGANSFSAEQGYSEHQLGTAIDFTTPAIGGGLTGFHKTTAYTWLQNNAYKYGWILSYPQHNTFYVFEPWHWRFIGIELATRLHTEQKNFYDLDQRDITTYLAHLFNNVTSSVSQ